MNLFVRRVAVLGPPAAATQTIAAIGTMRRLVYRVEAVAQLPAAGLASRAHELWGVVCCGEAPPALPAGVRCFDMETFWEDQLGRIAIGVEPPEPAAALPAAGPMARPTAAPRAAAPLAATVLRRGLDIVLASVLLLLTAPILLLTALLIRLESAGPVIYRQERAGLDGRPFTLWKFRSMHKNAERAGPVWATMGDARVTRVGRVIRLVRIDELPQLVNVVRGEMSMVGPRPERPHFVAQLAEIIPRYAERCLVRPGLTGWAQVNCPYGASIEDARTKLSYDLYYVKHRSLLFDLLILLATVRVILFQEGAR